MAKNKHSEEAAVRGSGDEPVSGETVGGGDVPPARTRKPRTPRDPATMTALEAKLHRVKVMHNLVEAGKSLDAATLAELIGELGKLTPGA